MTTKRIFGFIFIVLAMFLTLAILGQLPSLFRAMTGFFRIFTGTLDADQAGYFIGTFIYWVFHFAVVIVLWIYGLKWMRRSRRVD